VLKLSRPVYMRDPSSTFGLDESVRENVFDGVESPIDSLSRREKYILVVAPKAKTAYLMNL